MKVWAIVPAAGVGARMGLDIPKQYLQLNGLSAIDWSVKALLDCEFIDGVYVGLDARDTAWDTCKFANDARVQRFKGGASRAHTVRSGLNALAGLAHANDWVMVHDAARACVTPDSIASLYQHLEDDEVGGILAVPLRDTVKRVNQRLVQETLTRENLWAAQTPQMFRYQILSDALSVNDDALSRITDEASAIEQIGFQPKIIEGQSTNIKLTYPGDELAMAATLSAAHDTKAPIKIGQGYDVHAFEEGDYIILGGVKIPHHQGIAAHSDGDVLLHAIADALLGALALGDIGYHFPDTDAKWKGADSLTLLRSVYKLIQEKGYVLGNVDCTVCAQEPKLASHIVAMRKHIADALAADVENVSVKATTTEKLGFVGRKEGIACYATCLLYPNI